MVDEWHMASPWSNLVYLGEWGPAVGMAAVMRLIALGADEAEDVADPRARIWSLPWI